MHTLEITDRQRELLEGIYHHFKNSGYSPSFEDMRDMLNVSSNQAVIDLLNKLEEKGLVKKNGATARSLIILPLGFKALNKPPLAPFLGSTSAGFPMEAIEAQSNWQQLSTEVSQLQEDVFVLKISGYSMINAGISNGDLVLVKNQKEFASGDIVLARVGESTTVKRFVSDEKPPFIYLKPENPEYKIIPFTEDTRLIGKIISVFNNQQWGLVK